MVMKHEEVLWIGLLDWLVMDWLVMDWLVMDSLPISGGSTCSNTLGVETEKRSDKLVL